jgi:polysaccharide biosynthesis transport protein
VNVTANAPELAPAAFEDRTLLISDFIRVVRRYFWLMVALSFGFASLAFLWAKHQPKLYDATAMIEVDQHDVLSLSSASGGLVSDDYELKITTLILAMQSRDVALNVIQRLHLEKNSTFNPSTPKFTNLNEPETRNKLVRLYLDGLEVQRVPKSELVSVTYRSRSPVLSTQIANATVDAYLETNFQHHYQGSKEITGWLTTELDELKARVQKEQSDLLNLEAQLGLFSQGSQTETSMYEAQLEEMLAQSIQAQAVQFQAAAQYQQMQQDTSGASPPNSVPGALVLNSLLGQLSQLDSQKAALTQRYGPGYTPLQQIESSEVNVKKSIAEQRQRMLDAARESLQAAQKTESDIQNRIDELKVQAKGMTPDAVRFYALKAQYTTDQTLYNGLLSILSAGGIQSGLKTQEVNRMSTADFPTSPSRPRTLLTTMAGFGIGVVLAVAIIVVIVAVSDTVQSMEQVEEALALPIVAAVPLYKLEPTDPSSQHLNLITQSAPRSPGSEAYRILRTSINLMPVSTPSRVIGITSCGPGEGKSTTSMNLGAVFAQQKKRVLLIDSDLRKPTLAHFLKAPAASSLGLSRYLSDPSVQPEECIQPIPSLPGLSIVPVVEIPPFPSELLGSGRFEELIRWARQNFDVVLIDTPPAMLVADWVIVAQSMDILLLVARVGVAQRRALRRIRQELTKFPGKHVAAVINAVPESQSYYGGYRGYGKYYG